jgi:hypothetical protein
MSTQMSTCGELADYLATQPRDRKIVLSADAEGNSYSPLADAGERMYAAETTWSGDVYLTPEALAEQMARPGSGYTDEDAAPDDAERVIVLGPVN